MKCTYENYCETMKKQGKQPVSREAFEARKEELQGQANFYTDYGKAKQEENQNTSGFLGFTIKVLGKFIEYGGKTISNMLK